MAMTQCQLDVIEAIAQNDMPKARKAARAAVAEDTSKKNAYDCKRFARLLDPTLNPDLIKMPYKVDGILEAEHPRELPWTGVLDASGNRIRVGDRVKLFGIVGEAVFECGAYGIAFEDVIDWDAITGKIKEHTGCDNRPDFCFNDNFISFWELLWNFNCDDNCDVVERIAP